MRLERQGHLGVGPYERSEDRQGYSTTTVHLHRRFSTDSLLIFDLYDLQSPDYFDYLI
jgi:hypothetical protein